MKRKQFSTSMKILAIILLIATPLFVAMDARRLGYVPANGAWITWAIPALLAYESKHEVNV